ARGSPEGPARPPPHPRTGNPRRRVDPWPLLVLSVGDCICTRGEASSIPMRPRRSVLPIVLVALARAASAQLQLAEVRGVVREVQGDAAPAATVRLLDTLGRVVFVTTSDGQGRFVLRGVVPGSYLLEAHGPRGSAPARPLTVGSALPLETELRLAATRAEEVVVTAVAAPALSTGSA